MFSGANSEIGRTIFVLNSGILMKHSFVTLQGKKFIDGKSETITGLA